MVKAFNYPDLDILDSPLMSPFTSLNGVPASAIAENIFNDPDSWEENDDADADADMGPLAWLVEEIEKFKANSADLYGAFDSAVDNKENLGLTPRTGEMQLRTGLKGIDRTSKIRPISIPCFFEPAQDEDIQDRLSKILDASGIPHYVRPLSSDLTPPSTSKTTYYPSKINTSAVAGSNVDGPSPVDVHSSSITMSFLEWYGIYPESDQNLRSLRQQYRKSINSKKVSASMIPPSIHTMPPSPPLSMPPPGLEPPPHLSRSLSPASTLTQSPPNVRSRSPAGSRPNSNPRSRSSSYSRSQSPTSTQDISRRDSDAPTRRRRLPSIPLEASLLPQPPSSPKLPSTELPSQQLRPPSTSRPLPSISSPAGPRTRGSRVSSQESTTRGFSLQHQPGLRF